MQTYSNICKLPKDINAYTPSRYHPHPFRSKHSLKRTTSFPKGRSKASPQSWEGAHPLRGWCSCNHALWQSCKHSCGSRMQTPYGILSVLSDGLQWTAKGICYPLHMCIANNPKHMQTHWGGCICLNTLQPPQEHMLWKVVLKTFGRNNPHIDGQSLQAQSPELFYLFRGRGYVMHPLVAGIFVPFLSSHCNLLSEGKYCL